MGEEPVLLGNRFVRRASRWHPTNKRFWRISCATEFLLIPGTKVTGQEVEHYLGHLVSIVMLRREFLSLLHAVYVFVKDSYTRRQPLWPSVARELRWVFSLLPACFADIGSAWSPRVSTYDASPWGFGVGDAAWVPEQVAEVGGWRERSRFRG